MCQKQTAPEAGADHGGGQQVAGEVTLQRQQLPEKIPKPLQRQTISYRRSRRRIRLQKQLGSPQPGPAPTVDSKWHVSMFGDWVSFLPVVSFASFRYTETISSCFLHFQPHSASVDKCCSEALMPKQPQRELQPLGCSDHQGTY